MNYYFFSLATFEFFIQVPEGHNKLARFDKNDDASLQVVDLLI